MEAIATGDRSPLEIARQAGMSILELARVVTTTDNLKQLQQVIQLHDLQREMLLGQLKRKALLRLAELTDEVAAGSADEIRAAEVMRKACADLLRYGGLNTEKRSSGHGESGGGGTGSRSYHPDSITPAFEAEVLEALERLGQEDGEEEEDEEVYPQIAQITRMRSGEYENRNEKEDKHEPRARASGSVPPETTPPSKIRSSFDMQSGEYAGSSGGNASVSLSSDPRTRRAPLSIRSTQNRTSNNNTRTLPEDAHPP